MMLLHGSCADTGGLLTKSLLEENTAEELSPIATRRFTTVRHGRPKSIYSGKNHLSLYKIELKNEVCLASDVNEPVSFIVSIR